MGWSREMAQGRRREVRRGVNLLLVLDRLVALLNLLLAAGNVPLHSLDVRVQLPLLRQHFVALVLVLLDLALQLAELLLEDPIVALESQTGLLLLLDHLLVPARTPPMAIGGVTAM